MPTPQILDAQMLGIIDTAVKIGLGALIGVLGSVWTLRISNSHDFKKESFKRKQDSIEKIAEDFEQAHHVVQEINTQVEAASLEDLKNLGDSIKKVQILEAKLILLGLERATALLKEYRLKVVDINNDLPLSPSPVMQVRTKSSEFGEQLFSKRESFYRELAKNYQKPNKK